MDLSPIGEAVLIAREGRRLKAYRDSVGVLTIGVGHTSAAGPPTVSAGLTITAAECDAIFHRDVQRFVPTVRAGLSVDVPQHAFDALCGTRRETDKRKVLVTATPLVRERTMAIIGPLLHDGEADVIAHFTAEELDAVERFLVRATEVQRRHTARLADSR